MNFQIKKSMPSTYPKLELNRADKWVAKMHKTCHELGLFGSRITHKTFDILVDVICGVFPEDPAIDRRLIYAATAECLDEVAEFKVLDPLFHRLATARLVLARALHVPRFNGREPSGWTALEFVGISQYQAPLGIFHVFKLKGVAGSTYGLEVYKLYPINDPRIEVMMYYCGCKDKRSSKDPKELIRMKLWAEVVEREEAGNRYWTFARWKVDKQLKNLNSGIIRRRRGLCPRSFQHPCVACDVGRDECENGLWPVSLTIAGKVPDEGLIHGNAIADSGTGDDAGNSGGDGSLGGSQA